MKKNMKKVFFYDENGNITESFEVRENSQIDSTRVLIVTDIPKYTPKNGFYGKMIVKDGKLDYTYIPVNPDKDLTSEQLTQIFEEVM